MASKGYPTDILDQTTEILAACKQINSELTVGSLTQGALAEELTYARECQSQIASLEMQLADLRNRRDERLERMWDAIKRVRATVKGTYGDNSSQYELVGGTRLRERKRPVRRQPA
jgi:hypothetical protein